MNCQDTQSLIQGYLDGELDLAKSLEVERHLQDCPACSNTYGGQQALREAISTGALYYRTPAPLRKRLQASVRRTPPARFSLRVRPWRWLGVLASLAVVALVTWGLTRSTAGPSSSDLLTQAVVASHVRSMMSNHLADVASSDQHTVKPWFDGKLDFSPVVVDLANQGFPLIGGRLDYLTNRPVAALIYKRQQHVINLFIWPSTAAADLNVNPETYQGFHVIHWTQFSMTYWAVSDLSESELQDFVRLVQNEALP